MGIWFRVMSADISITAAIMIVLFLQFEHHSSFGMCFRFSPSRPHSLSLDFVFIPCRRQCRIRFRAAHRLSCESELRRCQKFRSSPAPRPSPASRMRSNGKVKLNLVESSLDCLATDCRSPAAGLHPWLGMRRSKEIIESRSAPRQSPHASQDTRIKGSEPKR